MAERGAQNQPPILEAASKFYFFKGEVSPPWEVIEGDLCDYFHCTPSQLDKEDLERALLLWALGKMRENDRQKCPLV